MFGKECSLCGGKLRGNICTECGLDNSKNDSNYRMTQSHHEYETLTHTHEKVNLFAGKTLTAEQRKEMEGMHAYDKKPLFKKKTKASKQAAGQYSANVLQKKKSGGKKTKIGIIVTIIVVIFSIVEMIAEISYMDWGTSGVEEVYYPEEEYFDESYDPYAYVQYELEDTGDYYGETLSAGSYKGGVHIPEGIYEVMLYDGEGQLTIENEYHGIYESFFMEGSGEPGATSYIEDLRIYAGTRIEIEENVQLDFVTNSAVYPIENMVNPNTESAVLENLFVVGEDIPAGVYDVICLDGSGIFNYSVDFGDGYTSYQGKLIGSGDSSFPSLYKNVVLPEGTVVEIEEMTVELVPSEIIESEDYLGYYQ